MKKFKWHIFKRITAGFLGLCLVTGQPGVIRASEEPVVTATPAPEHTESYSQAPDTDSIKGWPQGPKIEATSAVLMDVVTESVLYSKNADQQLDRKSVV